MIFSKKSLSQGLLLFVFFFGISFCGIAKEKDFNIGILLDQSASITKSGASDAEQKIAKLLDKEKDFQSFALWSFDIELKKVWEKGQGVLTIPPSRNLGDTRFFDALQSVLNEPDIKNKPSVLFLFTDGWDETSQINLPQLREFLRESNTPIFIFPTPGKRGINRYSLYQIASLSKGGIVGETSDQISKTDFQALLDNASENLKNLQKQKGESADDRKTGESADDRKTGGSADDRKTGGSAEDQKMGEGADDRKIGGSSDDQKVDENAENQSDKNLSGGSLKNESGSLSEEEGGFLGVLYGFPPLFWYLLALLIFLLILLLIWLRRKEQKTGTDLSGSPGYYEEIAHHKVPTNLEKNNEKSRKEKPISERIFEDSMENNSSVRSLKNKLAKKTSIPPKRTKIERDALSKNSARPESISQQIQKTVDSSPLYEEKDKKLQNLPESPAGSKDSREVLSGAQNRFVSIPPNLKEDPAKFSEGSLQALHEIESTRPQDGEIDYAKLNLIFEWIRNGCLSTRDFFLCVKNEKSIELLLKMAKDSLNNSLSPQQQEVFEALMSGKGYEIDQKNISKLYANRDELFSHQPEESSRKNLKNLIELTKNGVLKDFMHFALMDSENNQLNFRTMEIQLDKVLFISDHDLDFERKYSLRFSNDEEVRTCVIKHKELFNSKFRYFYKLQILG